METMAKVTFLRHEGIWWLTVEAEGDEHELGCWPTAAGVCEAALRWLEGRGLKWASDSARRLDAAQRSDAPFVTFDAVRAGDNDESPRGA